VIRAAPGAPDLPELNPLTNWKFNPRDTR